MQPRDLQDSSFVRYMPEARSLAQAHIGLLRRIPLSLLPLLLLQVREYDVSFPAERAYLDLQLRVLAKMDDDDFNAVMHPFAGIDIPAELASLNWVEQSQQFSERLTAWLWAQHQIDGYHHAAEMYQQRIEREIQKSQSVPPRYTFVMLGRGVTTTERPLFRKLSKYGTVFTNIDPTGGTAAIFAEAAARERQFPIPYGHWYIEGGEALPAPSLTTTSYSRLAPAIHREFALINGFTQHSKSGAPSEVEAVASFVASLNPGQLNLTGTPADAALRYFEANVLTQGAGCQIFSTTFVQWAARECLRRAQPLTLIARFANRQTDAPLEQLLARDPLVQTQDPQGSLVDADMGAYYTWINQRRLRGSDSARFLAWWEDRQMAVAITPLLPGGTTSSVRATIPQILEWLR